MNGDDFLVREQDTALEIQDCVTVLLLTPVGSRVALPAYGSDETLFQQTPIATPNLVAQITKWEPRVQVAIGQKINLTEATVDVKGLGGTQ